MCMCIRIFSFLYSFTIISFSIISFCAFWRSDNHSSIIFILIIARISKSIHFYSLSFYHYMTPHPILIKALISMMNK